MIGWETLKEKAVFGELAIVGPLNISLIMRQIEQEVSKEGPLLTHVERLFQRFAERLSPYFQEAEIPAEAQAVTELQLIKLQAALKSHYEDEGLEAIWNQRLIGLLGPQRAFEHAAAPVKATAIRQWLNDPANIERIQGVRALDLRGLNLKALPSEIGLFTGLQSLNLSNNELSWLPETIGNLSDLKNFYLIHNQLSWLPESIGHLRSLTGLYLSNNQLSWLPESIGSLSTLKNLYLSHNQLSSLPESIGNLKDLRILDVSYSQLSSLPETIGNLSNLTDLFLHYTLLSFLPETFCNLSNLTYFSLHHSLLSSLPETFGSLECLTRLDLFNNQLSSLPETIKNLKHLKALYIYDNPLMLVCEKEQEIIQDYAHYASLLEVLKKYVPQSPLAALFQAIGFNHTKEAIQRAYRDLSVDMQQRIAVLVVQNSAPDNRTASSCSVSSASSRSASSSYKSSIDLFADMGLFARSVRKAAYDLYHSLGQKEKDLVSYYNWDLAGRPQIDDPNWDENHVFDHALRFTDALERATR